MSSLIRSVTNPFVKHLVRLRKEAGYRQEMGLVWVEGKKLVQELLPWCHSVVRREDLLPLALPPACREWLVTESVMQKISGVVTPEGWGAEVWMPSVSGSFRGSFVLAIDAVQDPGNVGALLRSALALGWEDVYLLPGCADPFQDKAIRAAKGAQFRLSLKKGDFATLCRWAYEEKIPLFVADLRGVSPRAIRPENPKVLVLGNEGHGPSVAVKAACQAVTIPMHPGMESLNVAAAGAILLYALKG